MGLSVLALTLMDSLGKALTGDFALAQVTWARYAFHLLPLLLVGLALRRRPLPSRRPLLQLLRAALMLSATLLMFLSVKLLPLAETYAIAFLAPLLVAVLAGPTLGERVGLAVWLSVLAGFCGVLLVVRPGGAALGWAALAPAAMALAYALYQLATRRLAAFDPPEVTLLWSAVIGTVGASLALPWAWTTPTAGQWALMALMGAFGLVGQLAMIRAFTLAPASSLSPYGYTQIVWAVLIGWFAFGDLPDAGTLVGAAIVVASGLALFRAQSRPAPAPAGPVVR